MNISMVILIYLEGTHEKHLLVVWPLQKILESTFRATDHEQFIPYIEKPENRSNCTHNLFIYYFNADWRLSRTWIWISICFGEINPITNLEFDLRLSDILLTTIAAGNLLCFCNLGSNSLSLLETLSYIRKPYLYAEIFKCISFYRIDTELWIWLNNGETSRYYNTFIRTVS